MFALVVGYWVKLATDADFAQVPVDSYSHTFTTGIVASTCYDISIKAKFTCTGGTDTESDEQTIEVCSQPAVCVISSVNINLHT